MLIHMNSNHQFFHSREQCINVSFTVTSPLEVLVSILSTNGLFLENMYNASGFSLQANKMIIMLVTLIFYCTFCRLYVLVIYRKYLQC